MRTALICCLVLFAAAGDVQHCHTIADPDARNYCRAVAKGDPSICATIADATLRALCRVEAG